ncbi:MAG: NAD(+) synthase [Bacteroidaceae bacterium]|nr:NAD(+) synthase [Bacteroidaceae bacterium]
MKYGFTRTATAVPAITAGDCRKNAKAITDIAKELANKNVELILFPELCLTSSSCGDLFLQQTFIRECEEAISEIAGNTKDIDPIIVFGSPVLHGNAIYNCSVILHRGIVIAFIPKKRLENHEQRWFTSGNKVPEKATARIPNQNVPILKEAIFATDSYSFGIETGSESQAPMTPGAILACNGAEIILNPSACKELADSNRQTKERIQADSRRYKSIYMHANSGWGESTSNAVHSGYNAIAECGNIVAEGERFKTESNCTIADIDIEKARNSRRGDSNFTCNSIEYVKIEQQGHENIEPERVFNPLPFIPKGERAKERLEEIFMIQATALARRIEHTRATTCVIGISGGLDSTLALLVTEKACHIAGKSNKDIIAITMPGFGTSGRTYNNAIKLMQNMGVSIKEISIKEACIQHFKDIEHDIDKHDITYENSQARERTQILMDIANQTNGIVIGTGDLSELALGWATYNGDHMSMYGVNASVPKTLMQHLVRYVAENSTNKEVRTTLLDIIDTPISPELIPADNNGNIKQKTEDLVGPYELHDFFLYHFIHNGFTPEKIFFMAKKAFEGTYDSETIKKWLTTFMRRFFIQQFKRSCMPDGPVTGKCNLSPQGGWIMPADINGTSWNEACRILE